MATEIRTIIFTQDEVLRAVTAFRKLKKKPLPPGTVFKYSLHGNPKIHLGLAIALDGQDRLESVDLGGDELGAALVMFCIDNKIPLPARNATKRQRVLGDNLSLVISINATPQQLEDFTPTA